MICDTCKEKIRLKPRMVRHSHETIALITQLYNAAEKAIPKSDAVRGTARYTDEMGTRNNKMMWYVDDELVKRGKRVRFPVPEIT